MITIRHPLVVFDWGVLRAMPKGGALPEGVCIVLADTVLSEIANSKNPDADALKLKALLEHRNAARRVYVGRYWGALSRLEISPDTVVEPDQIIDEEVTEGLRTLVAMDAPDWPERVAFAIEGQEQCDYERRRRQFMAKCEGWSRWILERQSEELNRMTGDVNAQHKWIRLPHQVTEFVVQNNLRRFDGPAWRAALSIFPDRLAAGRWARIIIWYALMRSLNPTGHEHEFENNWDDAHYAFLASYTHRIATHDKGMKRLIAAVFPSVTVCSFKP